MKTRKLLAFLLSVCLLLSLFAVEISAAAESSITAYVSISKFGEFVSGKDGQRLAAVPVELTGKSEYNLDDLFSAVHNLFYDGENGYLSSEGQYGLSVNTFWGDSSGMFGYQINRGTENVMGLTHRVESGDFVDAYILKSSYPDSESYSAFDKSEVTAFPGEKIELVLKQAGYDENWNTVFSACGSAVLSVNGEPAGIETDENGSAVINFDSAGEYIVSAAKCKNVNNQSVPAITAPVCRVTVEEYPDACITVPSDVELYVGQKGSVHFVSFAEKLPEAKTENGDTTTYYFDLEDKKVYNYRVTSDDYITYAGKFTKTPDFGLDITEDMLSEESRNKKSVDRDTLSNNGYNVADIYLNINPAGHLSLSEGAEYQLVPLRNWEAVDSVTANYFIEPDYHFNVIDEYGNESDIVSVSKSGIVTAKKSGTAIVLVTYDAMNLDFGSGKTFYGAIWPENTGVFVVTVGESEAFETGITINEGKNPDTIKLSGDKLDAEHDCIYFIGESGEFTFTPPSGIKVSVAAPLVGEALTFNGFSDVKPNPDGSVDIPLKEGRNIVKLTKDGNSQYQVITARSVDVAVNGGEEVYPGDTVSVVFDTLYHPANKLAGVYNMNAVAVYTDVSGYEEKIIGGLPAQYNFASNESARNVTNVLKERNVWGQITYQKDTDLVIPADYSSDVFLLSGGMIYATGFGDAYGNHRGITLTSGKAPNLTAEARLGWLGRLPDIEIPVGVKDAEISSLTLNTESVKTDYLAGEGFDRTNLTVTANYDNGKTVTATNYTLSPEILTKETDKVTVTYRGKTAEIDVSVTEPKVTSIEVTTPPSVTSYKAGNTFDPTGMTVTAVYENGGRKETTEYSYSPNRELTVSDREMVITYTGEDVCEAGASVSLPISVKSSSASGGGASSNNIKVYFTLLGDEKHGEGEVHTNKAGNLETWISKTEITVKRGSYVIDAISKALSIAGIPYTNGGNYISSIKGLSEFDNGSLSGWMYTLNGKYPDLGVGEQTLKAGDKIVFHYTDDFTSEESYEDSKPSGSAGVVTGGGGGSSGSVKKDSDAELLLIPDSEEQKANEETVASVIAAFDDVERGAWYESAVEYSVAKGLFSGVSETEFAPDSNMTRAMLVSVLNRLENKSATGECRFEDVPEGVWYTDAVIWASENGIVSGVSETLFAPDENVTREQIAGILFRYARFKGCGTNSEADLSEFVDSESISDWAYEAFSWANSEGLILGTDDSVLSPGASATRAQVAAILMRFCENVLK